MQNSTLTEKSDNEKDSLRNQFVQSIHATIQPIKDDSHRIYSNRFDSYIEGSSLNLSRDRSKTHFDGFSLRFEDLIIWMPGKKALFQKVRTEDKDILKGVSGKILKGTMTAIIGPSGSGKTTLMNYLTGRQNESQMFRSYCRYYINGSKIDNVNRFKNIIGYVLQDDVMETSLTPRQLFTYYAKLRGLHNIDEKVKDVISLMALERCADTIVGDVYKRGLSGGERKRTSIGIEMVSDPNLLFLDEPTTGLDSATALDVMTNLADLKSRGITIVSTIHSPSKDILDLFDKVIMLVDGKLVYDGKPENLIGRLKQITSNIPKFVEPIEYFMKIIDKDTIMVQFAKEGRDPGPNGEIVQEEYNQRIKKMVEIQAEKTRRVMLRETNVKNNIDDLIKISESKNKKIPIMKQFGILLANSTEVFFRDFYGIVTKSLMFWMLAVILIAVFVNLGDIEEETISAIQNRAGFDFILGIVFFFIASNLTSTLFIPRKQIFLKDKQNRLYDDGPFFMAVQLYSLPLFFVNVTVSLVIIYFSVRLNNDPGTNFLWYWAFSFIGSFLGGGAFGMILGVASESIDELGTLAPSILLPQLVVAGYFANVRTMTWPLYIFSFITPARYSFQGFILTEFSNRDRYINSCNYLVDDANGNETVVPVPKDLISRCDPYQVYDFKEDTKWLNLVIVIVLNIDYRILAYILFKYKYREMNAIIVEDRPKVLKYTIRDDLFSEEGKKENVPSE